MMSETEMDYYEADMWLKEQLAERDAEIARLRAQVAELQAQNAELRYQIESYEIGDEEGKFDV